LGSGAGMEQKPNGMFLRATGKKAGTASPVKLSLLLDAYTNLGYYTGLEFSSPGKSVIKTSNVSFGLAWTKAIYSFTNNFSTSFDPTNNLEEKWDKSYLFGIEVPFRYRFKATTSIQGRFGTVSLSFPIYSDKYVDQIIENRAEDFTWIDLLLNPKTEDDSSTISTSTISSYSWSIAASPQFSVPQILYPYISTLSISSISSDLSFVSSTPIYPLPVTNSTNTDSTFFMPDKLKPYQITASIAGTPLSLGGSTSTVPAEVDKEPLKDIGEAISPWGNETKSEGKANAATNEFKIMPPSLSQAWTLPRNNSLNFSINYSISPTATTEMQYHDPITAKTNPDGTTSYKANDWKNPDEIKWDSFSSTLTSFSTGSSVSFRLTEASNNLFSTAFTFSGAYKYQTHNEINEEMITNPTDIVNLRKQDYQGRSWNIDGAYNTQLNPFYRSNTWKSTNFQYSLTSLIVKSAFDADAYKKDDPDGNKPDLAINTDWWKITKMSWDRDTIYGDSSSPINNFKHSTTANFNANIMNKTQSLSFSADLPPMYNTYSLSANANIWISSTSASVQLRELTKAQKEQELITPPTEDRIFDGYNMGTINVTETFTFGTSKNLQFYAIYDPELITSNSGFGAKITTFRSTFNFLSFSTMFTMNRGYQYIYDDNAAIPGWAEDKSKEMQLYPREWTFSFNPSKRFETLFGGYVKPLTLNATSSLKLDLQRYTYSSFTLGLSLTFSIANFIDFTIGVSSENTAIYRYLQDLPIFDESIRNKINPLINQGGAEKNLFIDLLNSFRFDNEELRTKSSFDMQRLNLKVVHHLGDWDATFEMSLAPKLDDPIMPTKYIFEPTISFYVQWIPIKELENGIEYKEKIFSKRVVNK
jgi:hypothetical protein